MMVFLIVVAVLFVAAILGYLVVRLDATHGIPWRDASVPGLPKTLLLSTGALLASSSMLHRGIIRARHGDRRGCAVSVGMAYWLGVLFVLLQCEAWWWMWRSHVAITDSLYAWTFYVLTALHALHIVGGLYGMGRTLRSARAGRYTPVSHNGLILCSMYWHALDAIWIVLYATLWIGSR
ncbi:MAG: heme-copper oxidase subunit III [Phycisphaerales bacterium]|nr:heme-copper oxidase subunit III [Phycisphaerales bacterium]